MTTAAQAVQDAADAGELLAAAALLPQPGREVRRRATTPFPPCALLRRLVAEYSPRRRGGVLPRVMLFTATRDKR